MIDPYRVDLATVVREAVEAAAVDAAGPAYGSAADAPRLGEVIADGMRLRQVLDNLIANAIALQPARRPRPT